MKKMHLKMSSGKWRPFRLGLNVLRGIIDVTRPRTTYLQGYSHALWTFREQFLITLRSVHCAAASPAAWAIIKVDKHGLIFMISSTINPSGIDPCILPCPHGMRHWHVVGRKVTRGKLFNMVCCVIASHELCHNKYTPLMKYIFWV